MSEMIDASVPLNILCFLYDEFCFPNIENLLLV